MFPEPCNRYDTSKVLQHFSQLTSLQSARRAKGKFIRRSEEAPLRQRYFGTYTFWCDIVNIIFDNTTTTKILWKFLINAFVWIVIWVHIAYANYLQSFSKSSMRSLWPNFEQIQKSGSYWRHRWIRRMVFLRWTIFNWKQLMFGSHCDFWWRHSSSNHEKLISSHVTMAVCSG